MNPLNKFPEEVVASIACRVCLRLLMSRVNGLDKPKSLAIHNPNKFIAGVSNAPTICDPILNNTFKIPILSVMTLVIFVAPLIISFRIGVKLSINLICNSFQLFSNPIKDADKVLTEVAAPIAVSAFNCLANLAKNILDSSPAAIILFNSLVVIP